MQNKKAWGMTNCTAKVFLQVWTKKGLQWNFKFKRRQRNIRRWKKEKKNLLEEREHAVSHLTQLQRNPLVIWHWQRDTHASILNADKICTFTFENWTSQQKCFIKVLFRLSQSHICQYVNKLLGCKVALIANESSCSKN